MTEVATSQPVRRSKQGGSRMNILLLFPDQHRHDWVPSNPTLPLRMPCVEALMRRGAWFHNALTPSPLCAPARACLASGGDYDQAGVPDNHVNYPLDQPTLYQRLRDAGYRVGGVGKFDLHKATKYWGLDGSHLLREWGYTDGIDNEGKRDAVTSGEVHPNGPYMAALHDRGLAAKHVQDFAMRKGKVANYTNTQATPLPDDAYCDNWVAQNALDVLTSFPLGQPWYLAVNFTGPHSPMDITESMRKQWQDVEFPPPVDSTELDARTHCQIRRNYAAMLENIDRHVGRLLIAVADRGELDNTLVVYSSDHGEMLGDHGRWGKSSYYHPSVGVPMIVAGPGVEPGLVSDALVTLQDLTATFLETAGAAELPGMDGRSLWPCLSGERQSHRPYARSALDGWRLVTDGRYRLVEDRETTLLFDHIDDPDENRDIAHARGSEVDRLRSLLSRPTWTAPTDDNA